MNAIIAVLFEAIQYLINQNKMVPRAGIEPARLAAADFKSATSTDFVIGACFDIQNSSPLLKSWLLTEIELADTIVMLPGKLDVIAQTSEQGDGKATLAIVSCLQIIELDFSGARIYRQP